MKKSKPKTGAATTGLVAANVLSGIYTPLIKYSLRFMPLYNFALLRHAGPAILMAPFMVKRWKPIGRRDLLLSMLCGLILYCGTNLLIYLGLKRTSSIDVALILMLEPLLLFVFSVELMRERFKKKVLLGIMVAFLGVATIILGPTTGTNSLSAGGLIGNLLVLLAVCCSVIGVWIVKYLSKRVPTLQVLFIGLVTAATVYLMLAFPTITNMVALSNHVVFLSVLYGIIGVGIASYGLSFWSLKTLGGQDYGLITYVEPTVTALVAFIFFKESANSLTFAGIAVVFIGIWLAEVRAHSHGFLHKR